MIEALRKENEEMKKAIQRLTEVVSGLCVTGLIGELGDSKPQEQPMEVGATATSEPSTSKPMTREAENAQEPKEVAHKKRVTEKRGSKEITNIDAQLEAVDARLGRLERKTEKMFTSLKTTIERRFPEVDNTYTALERSNQLIMSHPIFAQKQDPRVAAAEGNSRPDQPWPQQ